MDFERDWNIDAVGDRQQVPDAELSALAVRVKAAHLQPGTMRTVAPNADGVVVLPAGTDIDQIDVAGRNLIVKLPDGTQMVILDGAVVVPRIIVGDVEIPSVNLAALLIGEEPQPAAGPPRSSGGNFLADEGAIGDPFGLGDLLPPTELQFTQAEQREVLPIGPSDDDEPEGVIVTPNQPAGAASAAASVSEAGLGVRGNESAGSDSASDSERTSGTIVFSAADTPAVVTINGVAVTGVGQTFTTPLGVLTITSITEGSIGYNYVLSDNVVGAPPAEVFTVVVTDSGGDQATATLTISIVDDAPFAGGDVDSVSEDGALVADGNLFTGVGGSDENGTDGVADVQGADGASVTTVGTFPGSYGQLIISADGGYSYTLANSNPAVQFLLPGQTLTDSFSYTITDGDGDPSSATLTITITGADDGVTITGLTGGPGANGAELAVLENDLSDGSSPDAAALTQNGSFSVAGADGLSGVTVGGVAVLANGAFVAGQTVTTPLGVLTITGFTATAQQSGVPTAGTFTYSFVLTDNSLAHDEAGADDVFQNFEVVATDRNGSSATGSLDVQIVDDTPTARGDVDAVAAGSFASEEGNVITGAGTVSGAVGADTKGADGAAVAGVAAGAGGAELVDADTVGQAVAGTYGVLTLNGDGSYSYVRAAGAPGGVSDSFTYTLRDGDGDLAVATLRIDIADSGVTVSVPKSGAGTQVDESGLDAGVGPAPGSNAAADTETTVGVISFSAPDGPATVTINGVAVAAPGDEIVTDKGVLTIIAISEGQIDYSYRLTSVTSGDDVTDSFDVTVTDVDGESATDTLVIAILDDAPTAVGDEDGVQEDGPIVADGNVLTGSGGDDANGTDGAADTQGADGASVTGIAFGAVAGVVGDPVQGAYGALVILADGRYVYTLDNDNGWVQGLDRTQHLTETFTYTITDGDGDPAEATLTIAITGSDDGVTITDLGGGDAEEIVLESNLADGSAPDEAALTQTGSFALTALDGVATITVAGQAIFTGGAFVPGTVISNGFGTLSIDGFTPTLGADGDVIGGVVSYSYVLGDNSLLHSGANGDSLTDSFEVIVSDTDGSQNTASLDISIVDDAPFARDDVAQQDAENASVVINVITGAGTVTGVSGADTLGADGVDLTVAGGKVSWTLPAQGDLFYEGNGQFRYVPHAGAAGEDSFTYTITDGDNDPSTATVTIQLMEDSTPTVQVSDLTVSEAGLPLGTAAAGDSEIANGAMVITTGNDTIGKVEVLGRDGWIDVTNATEAAPRIVFGLAGTLTVTKDASGNYLYSYRLTANDPTHPDNIVDADGISGAADPKPGDSFDVRVTDSDNDVSLIDTIHVTVLDDAPTVGVSGPVSVVEGATATGTWTHQVGADQQGAQTLVQFNGQGYPIGTPINTGLGTLTVFADHTWRFVASSNANNGSNPSVTFAVQVTDADQDVVQATQTISITDGANPVVTKIASITVDEKALGTANATGTIPTSTAETSSDTVSFLAGSDNITSIAFTTVAGISTDVNGVVGADIVWTLDSATQITGRIGGIVAITLTLTPPALPILAGASGSATVAVTISDNFPHPFGGTGNIVLTGITVTATDTDNDFVTASTQVTIIDDAPIATAPKAVTVTNSAGQSNSAFLDADNDVDNNYGADGGKIIFTQSSIDTLVARGLTSATQALSYAISADGLTVTASNSIGTVFTVQLQPAGFADKYVVSLTQSIDSITTVDFNDSGYKFVGGNDAWAGFIPSAESGGSIDNNSRDLLMTPEVNGVDGSTINSSSISGGVGMSNSVGSSETFRVDFVTDLRGNTDGSGGYGMSGNRDHVFDGHYNSNGSSALFTATSGSTIKITAFDDPDGNNVVGDGAIDAITKISISYNGVSQIITPTSTSTLYTINGIGYTVVRNGDGSVNVGGVYGSSGANAIGTKIAVFTANGYNSVEYSHAGGSDFKIGDFGAAVQSTNPVTFTIPVAIMDGDGDTVPSGSLSITAGVAPPVVFDLDGDGLEFVGLSAGVSHDYGDGAVATAWVERDDGLLAHAAGGRYDIVFADDAPGAASDLEGLRLAYDSNSDGVFDAKDAAFNEFGVWQDANSNGQVDADEFVSLTQAGVVAIELTSDGQSYQAAGSDVTVLGEASFIRADGSKGVIGDVMFTTGAKEGDTVKAESNASGFNQALVAASLVAATGVVEKVEQAPDPVAAESKVSVDTVPVSTTPAEIQPAETEKEASISQASVEQDSHDAGQPAEQASHGGDDPAPTHASLSDSGDAPAPGSDAPQAEQLDLGDHQGLLAQSIDLPSFDGAAAALAAAHEAAPAPALVTAAEVVTEALGAAGGPDIDALLASLPVGGGHSIALFNPIVSEVADGGHMAAAAAGVFDAAMAMHEAMAAAHG